MVCIASNRDRDCCLADSTQSKESLLRLEVEARDASARSEALPIVSSAPSMPSMPRAAMSVDSFLSGPAGHVLRFLRKADLSTGITLAALEGSDTPNERSGYGGWGWLGAPSEPLILDHTAIG